MTDTHCCAHGTWGLDLEICHVLGELGLAYDNDLTEQSFSFLCLCVCTCQCMCVHASGGERATCMSPRYQTQAARLGSSAFAHSAILLAGSLIFSIKRASSSPCV